jgi:hypothetical protein
MSDKTQSRTGPIRGHAQLRGSTSIQVRVGRNATLPLYGIMAKYIKWVQEEKARVGRINSVRKVGLQLLNEYPSPSPNLSQTFNLP